MKGYFSTHRLTQGFTLFELLVVVGLALVVAVVLIVTLNPSELLHQARDSRRMRDLDKINAAIRLYAFDVGGNLGQANIVYTSLDAQTTSSAGSDCSSLGLMSLPSGWVYHCAASSTFRRVDGTGWVPINFAATPSGNQLDTLPIDPLNSSSTRYFYTYQASAGQYELNARFQGQKYGQSGQRDVVSNDGGDSNALFERGSLLSVAPSTGALLFPPLLATTTAATGVGFTSATVNAQVNPQGISTTVWFEYGPTVSYGSSTSAQYTSSSIQITPSASLAGLQTATIYNFRVNAQNSSSLTHGGNLTFGTSLSAPSGLTATSMSTSQINLSWTNSDGTAQTRLYRNGSLITTVSPGTASYSDTGLAAGTTYGYTVRHFKNGVESSDSVGASAMTTSNPVITYTGPVSGSQNLSVGALVLNSVGTYSLTIPVNYGAQIRGSAGGGGGGGGRQGLTDGGGGGGGGGGAANVAGVSVTLQPGVTYIAIVGDRGSGGSGNNDGSSGGATSFQANGGAVYLSLAGGGGGYGGDSGGGWASGGSGGSPLAGAGGVSGSGGGSGGYRQQNGTGGGSGSGPGGGGGGGGVGDNSPCTAISGNGGSGGNSGWETASGGGSGSQCWSPAGSGGSTSGFGGSGGSGNGSGGGGGGGAGALINGITYGGGGGGGGGGTASGGNGGQGGVGVLMIQ